MSTVKRATIAVLTIAGGLALLATAYYVSRLEESCAAFGDRIAGVQSLKSGPVGTFLHADPKCASGYRWVRKP